MRASILTAVLLAASGCFRIHYVHDPSPAPRPSYEKRSHNALYGIVEVSDALPVGAICPVDYAEVYSRHAFLDTVISVLSVGQAIPQSVTVTCSTRDADPSTAANRPWP